jgi:hypothetical protein
MAIILTINKDDTAESIQKKMKLINKGNKAGKKGFPAHKFTGKIKSFGDGMAYQRKLRNEWE